MSPGYSNPYNAQNGSPPYNPPNGNIGTRGYSSAPWEQQSWKNYAPEPVQQNIPVQGRFVKDIEEIVPREVPMDGTVYFFPKDDYSCVFAKVWTNNGELKTFRFLPERMEPASAPSSQPQVDMQQMVGGLASALDQRLTAFEAKMNDILSPFVSSDQKEDT